MSQYTTSHKASERTTWIPNVSAEPFRPSHNSRATEATHAPIPGKRYAGKIKSFNTTNGFGFIQCQETEELYGRDVFFNHAIEGGVEAGAAVSFELLLNSDGQPQARAAMRASQYDSEKTFRGRVRSFNSGVGYGFIECEMAKNEYKRDVFLHSQQVKERDLKIGDTIEFKIMLNAKKQPQAREISKVTEGASSTQGDPQNEGELVPPPENCAHFEGRIRSFNATQGFGFIASEHALKKFGHQDVFIHKNNLPSRCQPGCMVDFDVTIIKNRPQARNVTLKPTDSVPVDASKGLSFGLFETSQSNDALTS